MDICFTAGWMKIKKGSFTTGKRKKKSGKILRVVAFHAHAHRNLDRTITDKSFPMKLWQTFDQKVGLKIWQDSHETPLRTKHQLLIIFYHLKGVPQCARHFSYREFSRAFRVIRFACLRRERDMRSRQQFALFCRSFQFFFVVPECREYLSQNILKRWRKLCKSRPDENRDLKVSAVSRTI